MNEENKYIIEWSNNVSNAAKALEEHNFDAYERFMEAAKAAYELYKEDTKLTYECVNFGIANYIFEEALPSLFKSKRKAMKEFIQTIKEDKNLLNQLQFYKALEKYNSNVNSSQYINEALEIAKKNIDRKTISKSNKKLSDIIKKYNIKPSEQISEEYIKLFESCDYLFKNEKKLNNLTLISENIKNVVSFTEKNYNSINESKDNIANLIEDFNKKYNNLLNEEEKSFVKEIMNFKSKDNDSKKEKLFNRFKNECLSLADKMIAESSNEEKNELIALKEKISNKYYCQETVVKDLAKLLEIRDILAS